MASSGAERGSEVTALVRRGWDELRLQRPLAAWACWQRALLAAPGEPAATEALERLAGSPMLPQSARMVYRFRSPSGEAARRRWDVELRGQDLKDLGRAAAAFAALANKEPADAEAVYNLALCEGWSGRQVAAIEALDRYVGLVASGSFDAAADAWTLAEVLRHGAGGEEQADDLNYKGSVPWPEAAGDPAELVEEGCVVRLRIEADPAMGTAQGQELFEWLDRPMPTTASGLDALELPWVLARVAWDGRLLRYASPSGEDLERAFEPGRSVLAERIEAAGEDWYRQRNVLALNLLDAAAFGFRIPDSASRQDRDCLTRGSLAWFYENRWLHQPRWGLASSVADELPRTPIEASVLALEGDATSAAKLEGVIRLREQLSRRPGHEGLYASYPFDRLRRRVGLPQLDPGTVEPGDFSCMSRAELRSLDLERLTGEEIARASRSAEGLNEIKLAATIRAAAS